MPSSTPTAATTTSFLSALVPTSNIDDGAAAWRSHTGTNIRPRPSTATVAPCPCARTTSASRLLRTQTSPGADAQGLDRRRRQAETADALKTDDGPRPPGEGGLVTKVGELAECGADAAIVHQPTPASVAAMGDRFAAFCVLPRTNALRVVSEGDLPTAHRALALPTSR
jgi:hypothetical protein